MAKKKVAALPGGQSAAALADENAQRQTSNANDRLSYSLTITANHFSIKGKGAFDASVREALDEPFEQQHMLNALNTVEGPWAQADSSNAFRWLPVMLADLKALTNVSDFVRMVFNHLVPAA